MATDTVDASSDTAGGDGDSGPTDGDAATGAGDAGDVDSQDTAPALPGPLSDWCRGFQPDDFSFFVTSMDGLWVLAGSELGDPDGGFGGNLGGLEGADTICQTLATATGFGHKTWRAFLSATNDGDGGGINAIDRIGEGPWVDANGRLVATGKPGLVADERPDGDPQSTNDLPDECGIPLSVLGDSHDVLTGSDRDGRLATTNPAGTCLDWTSDDGAIGGPIEGQLSGLLRCGHSFPRASGGGGGIGGPNGANFASDHGLAGCARGAVLVQGFTGNCVGCLGGYGALYCFASDPMSP